MIVTKDTLCLSVRDALNCEGLDEQTERSKALGFILLKPTNFDRLTNCVCYMSPGSPEYRGLYESASGFAGQGIIQRFAQSMEELSREVIFESEMGSGVFLNPGERQAYDGKVDTLLSPVRLSFEVNGPKIVELFFDIAKAAKEAIREARIAGVSGCLALLGDATEFGIEEQARFEAEATAGPLVNRAMEEAFEDISRR